MPCGCRLDTLDPGAVRVVVKRRHAAPRPAAGAGSRSTGRRRTAARHGPCGLPRMLGGWTCDRSPEAASSRPLTPRGWASTPTPFAVSSGMGGACGWRVGGSRPRRRTVSGRSGCTSSGAWRWAASTPHARPSQPPLASAPHGPTDVCRRPRNRAPDVRGRPRSCRCRERRGEASQRQGQAPGRGGARAARRSAPPAVVQWSDLRADLPHAGRGGRAPERPAQGAARLSSCPPTLPCAPVRRHERSSAECLCLFRGHTGIGPVRAALPWVDGRHESPGETRTAHLLRLLGLRARAAGGARRRGALYRPDFRVRGTRVLVEFDGAVKYAGPARPSLRRSSVRTRCGGRAGSSCASSGPS